MQNSVVHHFFVALADENLNPKLQTLCKILSNVKILHKFEVLASSQNPIEAKKEGGRWRQKWPPRGENKNTLKATKNTWKPKEATKTPLKQI